MKQSQLRRPAAGLLAGVLSAGVLFACVLSAGVLSCLQVQSTPALAAEARAGPQSVAYAVRTKKPRTACYPVWAQCTKDADCCTGFCRVGRVTAYCDYN
jgi:hypothetical protein